MAGVIYMQVFQYRISPTLFSSPSVSVCSHHSNILHQLFLHLLSSCIYIYSKERSPGAKALESRRLPLQVSQKRSEIWKET